MKGDRVRARPYPLYKPSGIEWLGDVPEHWEVDRLKRSSLRVTDGAHISPDLSSPDFPFVSTVDLSGGKIDFDGCLRTSDECYSYLVRTGCRPHQGDLLFSKDGTVGRTALVEVDREFVVASSLVIVSPRPTRLDAKFLDYWLNNSLLQQDILLQMSGAALRRISVEKVSRLPVWLPSPTEQQAIAAFLDRETGRIDELVAKKRELIERLKEKRTALISLTVTRGLPAEAAAKVGLPVNPPLKPSGLDWLGDIPAHWEVKRLKFLITERLQYGANESAEMDDPNLPRYVRITDIDDSGKLRSDTFRSLPVEVAKDYLLEDGDVLFARSGATSGKTFLYRTDWGICAYAGYLIRARLDQKKTNPAVLRYFTASSQYWQWLSSNLIQATIQNVSAEKYSDLMLPLPCRAEQRAIVKFLDSETAKLDALVTKVETALERLQEYRTAIITAAVTGKIDVREEVVT